jgi:hypothetical protein
VLHARNGGRDPAGPLAKRIDNAFKCNSQLFLTKFHFEFIAYAITRFVRSIEFARIVMIVAGFVLLTAAAFRATSIDHRTDSGTGILDSRWFLGGGVEFEILFGIWLFSGWRPRIAWGLLLPTSDIPRAIRWPKSREAMQELGHVLVNQRCRMRIRLAALSSHFATF